MAITEIKISRAFKYNGIDLQDPNPALSSDAVREFYATQYPELTNAVVEGPVTKNNVATYTFQRAAGAKGRGVATTTLRSKLAAVASGKETAVKQGEMDAELAMKVRGAYRVLQNMVLRREASRPLHVPSGAFGIWG